MTAYKPKRRAFIKSEKELQTLRDKGINPQSRARVIESDLKIYEPYLTQLARNLKIPGVNRKDVAGGVLRLKDIFRAQAERTGSYLALQMKVGGYDLMAHWMNKNRHHNYFEPISSDTFLRMGFIQAANTGERTRYSMPVLGLEDKQLKRIKNYKPQVLIAALEDLLTYTNHDLLHHITSDGLNKNISMHDRFTKGHQINEFWKNFTVPPENSRGVNYENYLLRAQAALFHRVCKSDPSFKSGYFATMDTFFGELERICGEMRVKAETLPPAHVESEKENIKELANYLGEAALFSMMRLFPVMSREVGKYIRRREEIITAEKPPVPFQMECKIEHVQNKYMHYHQNLNEQVKNACEGWSKSWDKRVTQEMIDAAAADTDETTQYRNEKINEFRLRFKDMQTNESNTDCLYELRLSMERYGMKLTILDETGTKTVEEMENMLHDLKQHERIREARRLFHEFETDTTVMKFREILDRIANIRRNLNIVGVSAVMLDPTNASSWEEMEDRIEAAKVKAHLRKAHFEFAKLENDAEMDSVGTLERTITEIYNQLKAADLDAAALDETGMSSKEEMELRIALAKKRLEGTFDAPSQNQNSFARMVNEGSIEIQPIQDFIRSYESLFQETLTPR